VTRLAWWVWLVEVGLSTALIVMCVVAYQRTTRGAWRDSEEGRHLMAFMAAISLVLVTSLLRLVAVGGPPGPDRALWSAVVRDVVYAPIPAVFAWRLSIIIRAGRPGN
jgi:hypothetical protein